MYLVGHTAHAHAITKFKMSSRRVQSISDDLKNVEFETSEEVEVTPTFDSMGLREDLIRGIYAYGMES